MGSRCWHDFVVYDYNLDMSEPPFIRREFQFSLARIFFAVTLVAVGFAGIALVHGRDWPLNAVAAVIGLNYCSGAVIGAGLLTPFRKTQLGAILGFLVLWAGYSFIYVMG
jgi:hypothetical protein